MLITFDGKLVGENRVAVDRTLPCIHLIEARRGTVFDISFPAGSMICTDGLGHVPDRSASEQKGNNLSGFTFDGKLVGEDRVAPQLRGLLLPREFSVQTESRDLI